MNEIMSGLFFFVTVLLTDGPEGAEENVTHQQYGFHDASSNLNWSIPLKAPDTVGYQKDEINRFLRTAGSKKKLILCGGPHQKRKKTNTLPSQNCWRLKVKYESCSSRECVSSKTFQKFYSGREPTTAAAFPMAMRSSLITCYVKLDFILGNKTFLLQLVRKFQWK